jgi:hemolysin-activating ACP:hemolysin acyltransferase
MFFKSKSASQPAAPVPASAALASHEPVAEVTPVAAAAPEAASVAVDPSADAAAAAQRDRAAAARRTTAAFGQVMALILGSARHQRMTIAELNGSIAALIRTGQYALAGRRFKAGGFAMPVAAVLWAEVSEDVDRRLSADPAAFALSRKEISSGPIVWIVDTIGEPAALPQLLSQLREGRWKGRQVRVRALDDNKTPVVRTLAAA